MTPTTSVSFLQIQPMQRSQRATISPHWNLQSSRQEPIHHSRTAIVGEHPFGPTEYAMAAMESNTLSRKLAFGFRSSYDVAVPMRAKWKIPEDPQHVANDVNDGIF